MERPPDRLAVTHWSTRLLAGELGVGDATVARAWRKYGIKPWRRETFEFSTDPELEAKVPDVVGLLEAIIATLNRHGLMQSSPPIDVIDGGRALASPDPRREYPLEASERLTAVTGFGRLVLEYLDSRPGSEPASRHQ